MSISCDACRVAIQGGSQRLGAQVCHVSWPAWSENMYISHHLASVETWYTQSPPAKVFYPILAILISDFDWRNAYTAYVCNWSHGYLKESLDVPSMRSGWETVRKYASRVLQRPSGSNASTWLGAIAQMRFFMLQDKDFLWRCHDWNVVLHV